MRGLGRLRSTRVTGRSTGSGEDRVEALRLEFEALAKLSNRAQLDVAAYPELSAIVGAEGAEEWAAGVGELCGGLEEPARSAALCFFENRADRWVTTYEARSTAAAQKLGTTFHTFRTRDPKTGLSRRDLFFEQVARAAIEASSWGQTSRRRAGVLVAILLAMAFPLAGSTVLPAKAPQLQRQRTPLEVRTLTGTGRTFTTILIGLTMYTSSRRLTSSATARTTPTTTGILALGADREVAAGCGGGHPCHRRSRLLGRQRRSC